MKRDDLPNHPARMANTFGSLVYLPLTNPEAPRFFISFVTDPSRYISSGFWSYTAEEALDAFYQDYLERKLLG